MSWFRKIGSDFWNELALWVEQSSKVSDHSDGMDGIARVLYEHLMDDTDAIRLANNIQVPQASRGYFQAKVQLYREALLLTCLDRRRVDVACEALVRSFEKFILPDPSDTVGLITKLEAIQNARRVFGDLLNDPKMAWGVEWLLTMGVEQPNMDCIGLLNHFWMVEYKKDLRLVIDLTAPDGPVTAQFREKGSPS